MVNLTICKKHEQAFHFAGDKYEILKKKKSEEIIS